MAECNPGTLLDAAKCFLCLSSHQRQAVRIRILCGLVDDEIMSCDPAHLLEEAKCLLCLNHQQMDAVEVSLLCQLGSIGGPVSGGGSVLTGEGDPAIVPTTDAAVYTDILNSAFWQWDHNLAQWVKILG